MCFAAWNIFYICYFCAKAKFNLITLRISTVSDAVASIKCSMGFIGEKLSRYTLKSITNFTLNIAPPNIQAEANALFNERTTTKHKNQIKQNKAAQQYSSGLNGIAI